VSSQSHEPSAKEHSMPGVVQAEALVGIAVGQSVGDQHAKTPLLQLQVTSPYSHSSLPPLLQVAPFAG
jgi:hypothetical protein